MSVLAAARRAYDTVPFYRRLYGERPVRLRSVPAIGPSAFHRADSVVDCVVDGDAVASAVAPLCRGVPRLPFAPVEDRAEALAREQRLVAGLRRLGRFAPQDGTRFLLLADDATGPLAARLSNGLAAAGGSASILFHGCALDTTRSAVAALDPHCVVLLAGDPRMDDLAHGAVVRVVPVDGWRRDERRCDRLLFSDELHAIGAARAGEPFTLLPEGGLAFETAHPSGQLLVTTTAFTCMPLIRFVLGPAGGDLRLGEP